MNEKPDGNDFLFHGNSENDLMCHSTILQCERQNKQKAKNKEPYVGM